MLQSTLSIVSRHFLHCTDWLQQSWRFIKTIDRHKNSSVCWANHHSTLRSASKLFYGVKIHTFSKAQIKFIRDPHLTLQLSLDNVERRCDCSRERAGCGSGGGVHGERILVGGHVPEHPLRRLIGSEVYRRVRRVHHHRGPVGREERAEALVTEHGPDAVRDARVRAARELQPLLDGVHRGEHGVAGDGGEHPRCGVRGGVVGAQAFGEPRLGELVDGEVAGVGVAGAERHRGEASVQRPDAALAVELGPSSSRPTTTSFQSTASPRRSRTPRWLSFGSCRRRLGGQGRWNGRENPVKTSNHPKVWLKASNHLKVVFH